MTWAVAGGYRGTRPSERIAAGWPAIRPGSPDRIAVSVTAIILLGLLGLGVGAFGTIVGAGGGFILTPILLIAYPHDSPGTISAIGLLAVFFNAGSGSVAYIRQRRTDLRSGWAFAIATLPGAVLGALAAGALPRRAFDGLMALLLAGMAVWLIVGAGDGRRPVPGGRLVDRVLVTRDGQEIRYRAAVWRGAGYSLVVGFVSSLLGIGGGIIHVPVLVRLLGFPTHVATATSHFVIAVMAGAGSLTHVLSGGLGVGNGLRRGLVLAVTVAIGAQLGARLSRRMSGRLIERALAGSLILLAGRLAFAVL